MKNFNFFNLGTIYTNLNELSSSLDFNLSSNLQRSMYNGSVRENTELQDVLNRKLHED